jgi:hypothetical protein
MSVRRADRVETGKGRASTGSGRSHNRAAGDGSASQHVWRGASGTLYVHSVTNLIFCPEMAASTYILVHRDGNGAGRVLRVGSLENQAPSLNLAAIRQIGATLGANEVHIRSLARTAADRARVAFDIEHALDGVVEVPRLDIPARKEHSLA